MKKPLRPLVSATVVATMALSAAGLALAAPASAAPGQYHDVHTSSVFWEGVNDHTGYINDANPHNFAGDIRGWSDDAFDSIPDPFYLRDGVNSWDFVADDASSVINEGGRSVFTMTGNTGGAFLTATYDVTLVLTLDGNYAQWSYTITDVSVVVDPAHLAALTVGFEGNLGSDNDSFFSVNGSTMVSDDNAVGPFANDPVIGYNIVTNGTFNGWNVEDGTGYVQPTVTGASQFDLTLVIVDYEVCNGLEKARAFVQSIVATLPSTMGASYDAVGSCVTAAPLSLAVGTPVNQDLVLTLDAGLEVNDGYFNPANPVVASIDGLPAGLTDAAVRQADGTFLVTVTGTPTEAGTFLSTLRFHMTSAGGGDAPEGSPANALPLTAPFTVTVTAAATPPAVPPASTPAAGVDVPKVELAATGFDGQTAGLLGLFVMLAGVTLQGMRRIRRT